MEKQNKQPHLFYLGWLAFLASVPFLRPLLHLRHRKIINHAKIIKSTKQQIPVIYIHGFRGGTYTTKIMIEEACKTKHIADYLIAEIDVFGNIELSGTWTSDSKPIIQVIFKQKIIGVFAICYLLKMVLPFLSSTFNFSTYDAVGHSLGAPSIIRTEMKTQKKRNFPRLRKVALMAGPFDGVMFLGDIPNVNRLTHKGRPIMMNLSYLSMLKNRKHFPRNISVLNIYGNIEDETNTDRFISVVSAKSVRYILAPIVASFHEVEVRGEAAEHSEMHDNPLVIGIINRFVDFNDEYQKTA